MYFLSIVFWVYAFSKPVPQFSIILWPLQGEISSAGPFPYSSSVHQRCLVMPFNPYSGPWEDCVSKLRLTWYPYGYALQTISLSFGSLFVYECSVCNSKLKHWSDKSDNKNDYLLEDMQKYGLSQLAFSQLLNGLSIVKCFIDIYLPYLRR